MSPTLALLLWIILLLALLFFDPAKVPGTSLALWVPVTWMFIILSRLPSQWFGTQVGGVAQALEDGNPLDRTIETALILLAIGILLSRSFKWGQFVARNFFLTAFVLFALASVVWSDFPFIAFKHWFRDLGNYLVILVVLSDPRPLEALRAFLRRLYFLLLPLSIVLIKYYPQMSIKYSVWTGAPEYIGVTTSKNTLGVMCMLSGIFFLWDTVVRWSDRKEWRARRIILLDLFFLGMSLYLLHMSNSETSHVCLAIGSFIVIAVHSAWGRRHPGFLKFLIPGCFVLYLILAYGFNLNGDLASEVGRDPTLTGRTVIWDAVLSTHTNPILGTGYESFWLGPRLQQVWSRTGPGINEAHNGYLDIYLNMGMCGLFCFGGLLLSSYKSICGRLSSFSALGSLTSALFTIAFFYNMTEASFTASFMCLTFLLGTMVVPRMTNDDAIPAIETSFEDTRSGRHQGAIA